MRIPNRYTLTVPSLVAGLAFAASASAQPQPPSAGAHARLEPNRGGRPSIPGYRRWIDTTAEQSLGDGCSYRVRVLGSFIAFTPGPMGVGGTYLPDGANVESSITCATADKTVRRVTPLRLRAPVTREQLAQFISQSAELEHPRGRVVCVVLPQSVVDGGVPTETRIVEACEPRDVPSGIGGGP